MNFASRLTRIEAATTSADQQITIQAIDDVDFRRRFEAALLRSRPGQLAFTGMVGSVPFHKTLDLLPNEESLELLS